MCADYIWIHQGRVYFIPTCNVAATFETVDHSILLTFLKKQTGLDGQVLDLLAPYLTGHTQCESVNGVLSELSERI